MALSGRGIIRSPGGGWSNPTQAFSAARVDILQPGLFPHLGGRRVRADIEAEVLGRSVRCGHHDPAVPGRGGRPHSLQHWRRARADVDHLEAAPRERAALIDGAERGTSRPTAIVWHSGSDDGAPAAFGERFVDRRRGSDPADLGFENRQGSRGSILREAPQRRLLLIRFMPISASAFPRDRDTRPAYLR